MSALYLELLRRANALLSPLQGNERHRWRAELGAGFPGALDPIYETTNGSSGAEGLSMRLLAHHEVLRDSEAIRNHIGSDDLAALWAFWTDDNSNYAGVFLEGPLAGMVTFIDHDEPVPVPEYSSTDVFLDALVGGPGGPERNWSELAREYPRQMQAAPPLGLREASLKEQFLDRYRDAPDDVWSALVAMQFFSSADTDGIRQMLSSGDMWIQERACSLIGELHLEGLIDDLEGVARYGMPNGRTASLVALAHMRTERADAALARLQATLGPDFAPHFRR